jgi:hypothetical protein
VILKNDIGLLGDFLGTIPVMVDLASQCGGLTVIPHPDARWIFPYIDCNSLSIAEPHCRADMELDLSAAFRLADSMGLYMSQAHYPLMGLPLPSHPRKAPLKIPSTGREKDLDYVVAPFSRSLPPEQKWPLGAWKELFAAHPGLVFGVLANTKYDAAIREFEGPENVRTLPDLSFDHMIDCLLAARKGLLSIVTGPSHLAYHLGVRNILLVNQGTWGRNPEAACIETYIPTITPAEIASVMKGSFRIHPTNRVFSP